MSTNPTPRTPFAPPSAEEVAESPAFRKLAQIVELSEALARLAEDWLAEHGPGCPCPFCRHGADDYALNVRDDLPGLIWSNRTVAVLVRGVLPHFDRLDCLTPAEALTVLAEDARRIEAAGDGDPAPAVVER